MKQLLIVMALIFLTREANAQPSLVIRLASDQKTVELLFENTGRTDVVLDIPFEGAGNCDKYFDVEGIREGKSVRRSFLYAPAIPSFVVTLRPRGRYVHHIKPSAYLNNTEIAALEKLRVTYTNPLDETKTASNWINIANKVPEDTARKLADPQH